MEGFQARLLEGTQKIVEFQDLESCSQGISPSYGTSPISKWFDLPESGDFPSSYGELPDAMRLWVSGAKRRACLGKKFWWNQQNDTYLLHVG